MHKDLFSKGQNSSVGNKTEYQAKENSVISQEKGSINRVNHLVQQQIKEFDERDEEKLATSICDAKSTSEMWSLYNRYKNKINPINEPENPLKTPDNNFTANNVEKCNEFARHLTSVHQTPDSCFFDKEFKREIESDL